MVTYQQFIHEVHRLLMFINVENHSDQFYNRIYDVRNELVFLKMTNCQPIKSLQSEYESEPGEASCKGNQSTESNVALELKKKEKLPMASQCSIHIYRVFEFFH